MTVLAEDPRVNRLEDSFHLWKSVIENKLLAHVNIVLFLNKCDLLKKKLESGVRLRNYIADYNRPNDYETVSQCKRPLSAQTRSALTIAADFRNRFGGMYQFLTPNKDREVYSECFLYRACEGSDEPSHSSLDICHRYPDDTYHNFTRCVPLLGAAAASMRVGPGWSADVFSGMQSAIAS
ncbi:hypothetical protein NUW54_g14752 [Trametes sanguinea]|uniref:Uncharacterized protein n=1 Tax=Trametes sanguinea TaxID=158606 RepID=A0ACC1MBQ4_9APHY|nr:hypothetical protein NUW54_g14752 [Trametes sanguinea]